MANELEAQIRKIWRGQSEITEKGDNSVNAELLETLKELMRKFAS